MGDSGGINVENIQINNNLWRKERTHSVFHTVMLAFHTHSHLLSASHVVNLTLVLIKELSLSLLAIVHIATID